MKDTILRILDQYLIGEIDIDALEAQLIPLAWSVEGEDADLIDEFAAELAYVKDRVSDEGMFRERVAGLVARRRSDEVRVVAG